MMIELKGINNIIFDLGGVVLNIDYQKTADAFRKIGLENFDELFSQAKQSDLFDLYETGRIDSNEFLRQLKTYLGKTMSDAQIVQAWDAMLLDLPPERLELLVRLKDNYRIFLLSNTNEIHIQAYSAMLLDKFGFSNLSHLFEKEYYSFRIGLRKPNAEIFEFVLKDSKLIAGETLFIDDSLQHIEGARKVGIRAFHLKDGNTINRLFEG